ncbi:MAG: hypothetical protein AAFX44_06515 [Pseudomonadota bacterium]
MHASLLDMPSRPDSPPEPEPRYLPFHVSKDAAKAHLLQGVENEDASNWIDDTLSEIDRDVAIALSLAGTDVAIESLGKMLREATLKGIYDAGAHSFEDDDECCGLSTYITFDEYVELVDELAREREA